MKVWLALYNVNRILKVFLENSDNQEKWIWTQVQERNYHQPYSIYGWTYMHTLTTPIYMPKAKANETYWLAHLSNTDLQRGHRDVIRIKEIWSDGSKERKSNNEWCTYHQERIHNRHTNYFDIPQSHGNDDEKARKFATSKYRQRII